MLYYHYSVIIAAWIVGLLLFWRVRPLSEHRETRAFLPAASIVIPARNEEKNLEKLLKTLKGQCGSDDEVIIVDDDSSDGTSEVARTFGYKPVRLTGALPEGWTGKSWACWNGYLNSTKELLVFLDADVELSRSALKVLKNRYTRAGGLLSVQPYHRTEKLYEKVSLFFNLLVIASIGSFSLWKTRTIGSFGPCLVCSRADYEEVGGHRTAADHVLDDIQLARAFMNKGFTVNNSLGGSLVSFRMYPNGFRSIVHGWGKNFASGASKTSPALMLLATLWIAGISSASLWPVILKELSFTAGVMVYAAFGLQIWYLSRKIGNFGFLSAILYPVFLLFFFAIFLYSLIRTLCFKSVVWKGRKVDVSHQ